MYNCGCVKILTHVQLWVCEDSNPCATLGV